MDMSIYKLETSGGIDKEYVLLKANAQCDIGYYAIIDMTYDGDGKISGRSKHFYWFPHKIIKNGDYVSLRTGYGSDRVVYNDNGNRIHRFYWNLGNPIWNNTGDTATLICTSEWASMVSK